MFSLIIQITISDVVTPVSDSDPDSDFADSIFEKKIKNCCQHTRYEMVPVTSNVAERLFSRAKHVLFQYRMRILPRHLEGQIFLMVNESFWDVELVNKLF